MYKEHKGFLLICYFYFSFDLHHLQAVRRTDEGPGGRGGRRAALVAADPYWSGNSRLRQSTFGIRAIVHPELR